MMLMDNYFVPDGIFKPYFRSRFQMGRNVFDHVYNGVGAYDDHFILHKDAIGTIGFFGYQKCTIAFRMLAYGMTVDS